VTEDEAKMKWCPFARVQHEAHDRDPILGSDNMERFNTRAVAVNRHEAGAPKAGALCIASACMAWLVPHNVVDQDGYGIPNTQGSGFCGLAGAPQ
jgi:hypothetical protein